LSSAKKQIIKRPKKGKTIPRIKDVNRQLDSATEVDLMGLLDGKRALILGVASNRSIAWGIASAMRREGAELAFTYQNERLRERVENLAAKLDSEIAVPCDVSSDEQIQALFERLDDYWDHLDILVHAIAYAPRELLEGDYLDAITREGFVTAHEISSYSFAALANAARP
jgi:enoyl-[acyl-carrier protein] reductase I